MHLLDSHRLIGLDRTHDAGVTTGLLTHIEFFFVVRGDYGAVTA